MSFRWLRVTSVFLYACVPIGLCQSVPVVITGGPPQTIASLLKQHHIELTKTSLLNALRHSNPDVRSLAAEKLAEDNEQSAIPAINQALVLEKSPRNRIDIALALAQLGDENGTTELKGACDNSDLPVNLRLRAATYLLDLHKEGCLNAVLSIVESEQDPDYEIGALSLLPLVRGRAKLIPRSAHKERAVAIRLLRAKYAQYAAGMLPDDAPVIRITRSESPPGARFSGSPEVILEA